MWGKGRKIQQFHKGQKNRKRQKIHHIRTNLRYGKLSQKAGENSTENLLFCALKVGKTYDKIYY